MRRGALGTLGAPAPCPLGQVQKGLSGECVDDECSTSAELKRYVGWGLLGLMAGVVIGRTVFKQHPIVSATAGFAGGVAWAAGDTITKCGLGTHPPA
jgi:hypothetical protein